MSRSFDAAQAAMADIPRATLDEFIAHGKNNFVLLSLMFGEGFVIQAVEIAEQLKELTDGNS